MTATADFMTAPASATAATIPTDIDGALTVKRFLGRLTGAAFLLATLGLWITPGATWDTEMMLIKLGVSIVCLYFGFVLFQIGGRRHQPEVQFDPIRREMRVLRLDNKGQPRTVLRRSYDSLGAADVSDGLVNLWDIKGTLLLSLPVGDEKACSAIRRQLRSVCA